MDSYIIAASISLISFFLYRIGKQIYDTYQHIDEANLRDFWRQKLTKDDPEHRRIITHLGHCEQCRDLFDQIRKGKPLEDHLVD